MTSNLTNQSGRTLFISDLHLSDERADITTCFESFMQNETESADALYILGDLFEVWIGDDDESVFNLHIASVIREVADRIPTFFIHGNRDFAIGNRFAQRCNMQILPEQSTINLYGRKTLISHGDELCTGDEAYMKFRKKSRGWWWPKMMLALPLSWRRKIAEDGRKKSKSNKQQLAQDIMDVTKSEVDLAMQKADVDFFIHGHTHRPNIHHFDIDGKAKQRIVLGDWYDQGSILIADEHALSLETRPLPNNA